MCTSIRRGIGVFVAVLFFFGLSFGLAQSAGNSGTIYGTVTDPAGAILPNATVTIQNPVSGLNRQVKTDSAGHYQFTNLPFNPYHLTVSYVGFAVSTQDVEVRSFVPISVTTTLKVGSMATTVTVEAGDLLENDSTFHTDLDRDLFNKVPLESASSSLSSLVTLSTPGVAADSNGLFHGLGDHASNSFSIDGQPITDQQSKVFSNQIPSNSIQSITVFSGAPPAEFGGKTSLVIQVTTRSGQGITKPTGSISASYGTFGSATGAVDLSYGGKNWGNFVELDGLNTGRFLDPPEFVVFHDKGNELNFFDRIDLQVTPVDSIHVNFNYSRSWFQTPNSYDNLNVQNIINADTIGGVQTIQAGNAGQRSKIGTFDIAPVYTRTIGANSVFNFGAYVRRDQYNYYPSGNPLADMGPPNLQNQTISQDRSLTNAGLHTDFSYVHGIHNIKVGAMYSQTFLRENDTLGIVANTFNSPCTDGDGNPQNGFIDPSQCAAAGLFANDGSINPDLLPFQPQLLPYDLTRGGGQYTYNGRTDIKELALYVQDQIKAGNWLFNLGIRGDLYNGLTIAREAEPRLGVAYTIKKTSTVLRVSYARTLESPFNENLVLSSQGCLNPILNPLLLCSNATARSSPASAMSSTPVCSRPSAATWSSAATTSGSTPTMPSTSASSATPPSPSPSTGTTPRFPASLFVPMCRTSITSPDMSSCLPSPRGSSRRKAPEPERPSAAAAFPSASTTTSASTRPPTCNIRCPSNAARGSASTGATTAALPPAPCPAITAPPTPTAPAAHPLSPTAHPPST